MMFLSLEQPRVMLACIFFGILFGVYYEPFLFICYFIKKRAVKESVKFIAILTFSIPFTLLSSAYSFPDFRAYMPICVGIGAILYKFSLHKAVAILNIRVYNVIKITFKKANSINERRKEKARVLRSFKRYDNANNDFGSGARLSTRGHRITQKQNRKVGCGDSVFAKPNRANGKRYRSLGS
jgi:hypothetical protein